MPDHSAIKNNIIADSLANLKINSINIGPPLPVKTADNFRKRAVCSWQQSKKRENIAKAVLPVN